MTRAYLSRQRGLALVMAVLIAALAVTSIAFAAWRQQVRLRSVEVRADSAQAQLLMRASITIARTALIDDLRHDTRNSNLPKDDPAEELFTHREDTDVEKGHASGHIEDASGRLNLNELLISGGNNQVDADRLAIYVSLLQQLGLDATLADTLLDWMDSDTEVRPNGAEDMYYLGLGKPYRPGNGALAELSELLSVKGYTQQVIDAIKPYVDVFPFKGYVPADSPGARGEGNGTLNVNFCAPELLVAAFSRLPMDKAYATTLVNRVKQQPYQNFNDFYSNLSKDVRDRVDQLGMRENLASVLTVQSRYFYANLKLDYGRVHWSERVLLRRNNDRSEPNSTEVLRRVRLAD